VAPTSSQPVPAATPTPTPRSYKVQPGDSLRRIARQFGVTVTELLAANPSIPDADHVEVGQRLVIPAPPP
jgi:LysM repeat protein